jgi:hypothetical protein
MFIGIQIALLALGLFIMVRGRFSVGDREVGNPVASLVGIILIGQLPLALLITIVLALTAEPDATSSIAIPTRAGQPATPTPVAVAGTSPVHDNWWVDPLVSCGAVLLAAGMTAIALRAGNETDDVYASLGPADSESAR